MEVRLQFLVPVILTGLCIGASGQQQNSASPQKSSAPAQKAQAATTVLPPPPPDLLVPKIPSPEEVKAAQGPAWQSAPDTAATTPHKEEGFPALAQPSGSFSVSDHDKEQANNIVDDLIDADKKKEFGSDPPGLQSAITDAIASGSEKLGNVTSSDFLQKTFPALVKSELFGAVVNGGALALDSEPTAEPSLDNPNPMRFAQSALLDLGSVATGGVSQFGDSNMTQACDRVKAVFAQTQFNLNATQQAQAQSVINWCSQQTNAASGQVIGPAGGTRTVPAAPKQKPATPSSSSDYCPPGATVCR